MRWKTSKSDPFNTPHSNCWINSCNLRIMCKRWRLFIFSLREKKANSVESWTNIPDNWGELPIASSLTLFIQHAFTKWALIPAYLLVCSVFSGREEKMPKLILMKCASLTFVEGQVNKNLILNTLIPNKRGDMLITST